MDELKKLIAKHARRVYGSQWHRPLAHDARISQDELQRIINGHGEVPNFVVEALVDAIRAQASRLALSLKDLQPYRRSGRA